MAHIQPLGWVDTSLMFANFRLRYHDLLRGEGVEEALEIMQGGDMAPGLEKFASAKALILRLASAAAPFMGGAPAKVRTASIVNLPPNAHTEWSQTDDPETLLFQVALTNPPGAWLYCGGEAAQLGVGVVNYVNTAALHCSVNLSDCPRYHLVARVERPSVD